MTSSATGSHRGEAESDEADDAGDEVEHGPDGDVAQLLKKNQRKHFLKTETFWWNVNDGGNMFEKCRQMPTNKFRFTRGHLNKLNNVEPAQFSMSSRLQFIIYYWEIKGQPFKIPVKLHKQARGLQVFFWV